MPTEFVRPSSVPEAASWEDQEGCWELSQLDSRGLRSGLVTRWRRDGSLLMEARYEAGVLSGPFRRYHFDGRLAREGLFVDGQLDGEVWAHASASEEDEPLRACCVPPGAARMQSRYESGGLRGETFFDAEGFVLLSSGRRRPPRPAAVPEAAHYDESSGRWCHGGVDPELAHTVGTWTWWREDGSRAEEADFEGGHRVATRRFDEGGQLEEAQGHLLHEGYETIAHGPWRRRLNRDDVQLWAVPVGPDVGPPLWLEGNFDRGQSVGVWRVFQGERELWRRDLGLPCPQEAQLVSALACFDGQPVTAEAWLQRAQVLRESRHVREALVALARAVGHGAAPGVLRDAHAAWALPKTTAGAEAEGRRASELARELVPLMDAWLSGAPAAEATRLLSGALPPWHAAARDLAEASLALAPRHTQAHLARALACLETGDDRTLSLDVEALSEVSTEATAFFRDSLMVFRPRFAFWPTGMTLPSLAEPVPIEPAQTLDRVQGVLQVYATRLFLLRQALARFGMAEASWAPPVLTAFLPEGPILLRNESAEIEDEDEAGQIELTTVQIDETPICDDVGVSALMRQARASWAGLCWLLWAVGENEPAWPRHLSPRNEYPRALSLAIERAWRARDQLVTAGLRAMTQGVGDFDWEGTPVSELPRNLLEVCADEWIEVRAVLLWLSNAGNLSPFQSDLRQV